MRHFWRVFLLLGPIELPSWAAEVPVCVDVEMRRYAEEGDPVRSSPPDAAQDAGAENPAKAASIPKSATDETAATGRPLAPQPYLKRLIEHYVTHEAGFVSVERDCQQRVLVELYPLPRGFTVFARYSGNGREEKIDRVDTEEFPRLAERVALSLLHDVPIEQTVNRDNVLGVDSRRSDVRIRGSNHAMLKLGSALRVGKLASAESATEAAEERWRVVNPMAIGLGYRGRFQSWGIDALSTFQFGVGRKAPRNNLAGGHVDYAAGWGLTLHALRFTNPRGVTSWYYGGGATFDMTWFGIIRPEESRRDGDRETAFGGGLDLDLVLGYEFMRASAISFFFEGQLGLPLYAIDTETDVGDVKTWMPGVIASVGIAF